MPASQQLLLPDPKPLVERFGAAYFRRLPRRPGVYMMMDRDDSILYVGKARDLRQRLGQYRIANPDRMPRRIIRLLSAVDRIQLELCPSESAALKREAELLLEIKPRFNRAGVWKAPPRHLVWRAHPRGLELEISPEPAADWNRLGPLGGHVVLLRRSLVRLLWCLHHPERGLAGMPPGWFRGELPPDLLVPAPTPRLAHESSDLLAGLNRGDVTRLQSKLSAPGSRFEQVVRELDLEIVTLAVETFATPKPDGPEQLTFAC